MIALIDKLEENSELSFDEWVTLLTDFDNNTREYAASRARIYAQKYFGNKVYVRGLIEFSNFCKNNCLYCGIRRDNPNADRYRLSKEDILECCRQGFNLGFRTFVLQSGEDLTYSDDDICAIVKEIKQMYPECAVTLSIGEKPRESYQKYFDAGADRYLLRHETADAEHYGKLHPQELSLENRMQCLLNLKEIGFQTGAGFMVGTPYQTPQTLAKDMLFLKKLSPQMIGIGPFVPHKDTPFRDMPRGSVELTLFLLSLIRLMLKKALIPATTALGTAAADGRERGILAGANVVMPNLSPVGVRKKYMLYNNKICTGEEAAECLECLNKRMNSIGYEISLDRGDYPAD